jgi:hypothetical protein
MESRPVITLDESPRRVSKRVVSLDDSSEWAPYLRRAGFHEGVEVEVLSGRDPVMVRCMLGCVRVCALQEARDRARRAAR